MKTIHTKNLDLSKNRLIKATIIPICLILIVLSLVFCVRKTAISQAKNYIRQKYGDLISADDLSVTKVDYIRITSKAWPIFLAYDGIDFQIDLLNKAITSWKSILRRSISS